MNGLKSVCEPSGLIKLDNAGYSGTIILSTHQFDQLPSSGNNDRSGVGIIPKWLQPVSSVTASGFLVSVVKP